MCKIFGEEEFHKRRSGSGLHPEDRGKTISMNPYHDLFERMPLDRVGRGANHPYRDPPRKVEPIHTRKLIHTHGVNLIWTYLSKRTTPARAYRGPQESTSAYPNPSAKCRRSQHSNSLSESSGRIIGSRNPESYSIGAASRQGEGSEAVRCVRSQLCPIMAADLPAIITLSKTSGRQILVLLA